MAMLMFMSRLTQLTASVLASITATSWSGRSQPMGRPDLAACGPETSDVQLPLLSSIHWPPASFLTIRLTLGGAGLFGFCGGTKLAPLFGGGLTPP
jgi:hypothetical protein